MKRLCALLVFILAVPSLQSGCRDDAGGVGEQAETKIAFMSDRHGNTEIYVMNPDGSGLTRLTKSRADETGPEFSPDGSKIAFNSDGHGNNEIYVMNADGSGQTNLTNNPGDDIALSFPLQQKKK